MERARKHGDSAASPSSAEPLENGHEAGLEAVGEAVREIEAADPHRRELTPEDQARVNGFLKRGVNSVERKPFRPILLMIMLIVVVTSLSLFSQWLARSSGIY